ncbi:hypothetical protein ACTNBM_04830 [Lachnospiraceae bacterium HCP1S3_C3]
MNTLLMETAATGEVLKTALTGVDLNTVLSEVTGLLPVVLPVMVGFIAIRKGVSFLQGILHSA